YYFFFFQAEDGIRDFHVTGVQTCALPICVEKLPQRRTHLRLVERLQLASGGVHALGDLEAQVARNDGYEATGHAVGLRPRAPSRSEERRVGKECRSRAPTEPEENRKEKS